jgi:hypothetical protein
MNIPQAAPITDNATQREVPSDAQRYGEVESKNRPTLNCSAVSVKIIYKIVTRINTREGYILQTKRIRNETGREYLEYR